MQNFKNEKEAKISINTYLPHNFLAEKIILSSLLISTEAIENTLRKITIEAFYFKNHQEIYKAIIWLYQNKNSVDILTLISFLKDQGLLEKVGGMKVLTELINQVPNLVYLEEYIKLIQDKFLRRLLIQLGYQTINSSYITSIPLETIFEELEKHFFNLTNHRQNFEVLTTAELLSNVFLDLKQKSLNPTLPGLSSGFYDLDSITQGFQNSDLIIVAGRPSMGKTAVCLNIALNVLKLYKVPVLFFSLEMSKEQLTYRLLSNEIEITNAKLKKGQLNENDWINLNNAIKFLSSLPLFIDDTPNLTVQEIRSKIQKIILEQDQIGLIVIDYLQLMENSNVYSDNRVEELSKITRGLKNIAREFKVPLIVLSQLSRNVENRLNKRPILSDLRESGSIEQDADLVLMLYRDSYYNENIVETNTTELIIAKHRNGPIGTVMLNFEPKFTKFKNYNDKN
uniref:Replicative DNA helicase n=1 Tax=Rhizosolenia fallax TaxID=265545 RepID=A0A2U9NRA3_9STRA|nr:DNA replication helicase [Rhizosolenia fallax]AWT39619.1 DNA replication helicase [Rhizosolenia fallax]